VFYLYYQCNCNCPELSSLAAHNARATGLKAKEKRDKDKASASSLRPPSRRGTRNGDRSTQHAYSCLVSLYDPLVKGTFCRSCKYCHLECLLKVMYFCCIDFSCHVDVLTRLDTCIINLITIFTTFHAATNLMLCCIKSVLQFS